MDPKPCKTLVNADMGELALGLELAYHIPALNDLTLVDVKIEPVLGTVGLADTRVE